MFCPNCRKQIDYETKFCMDCGTTLNSDDGQQSQTSAPQKELSMGWFKFLIYFSLFAGAVINLLHGFQYLTGSEYGDETEAAIVYAFYDGLKTLDTIMGILCILLIALGIVTRFRLAKFRKDGPLMLTALYISTTIINLFYVIGLFNVLPSYVTKELDFTNIITSIIVGIVMIFVNAVYFKKRKHLFVN